MKEFDNPIIEEDELNDSRKNKIIMFAIIILGTILAVKVKEWAMMAFLLTGPIAFFGFFISLIVILVRFSDPVDSVAPSELEKYKKANPNFDYSKENVKIMNKKGVRKLKTLGIIFLSYIILFGIAYIVTMFYSF